VILTGIQPEIAQTIVQLGADMSGIATHGSLQSGIATVLDQHNQHKH
jgi:anti-anti-sigma regulatory factor